MSREEREEIRTHIINEIAALERSVGTISDLLESEVQPDNSEWYTSMESNPSKEVNELALEKAKQRIMILKEVLGRVDSPGFGICVRCNNPIPFNRMKAVPTATRCVSCGQS